MGAVKLLRPLYERVVTTLYLIKCPDEVSAFNDYGDILVGRFINRAKADGQDLSAAPPGWLADVERAYQEARPKFTDARGRLRGSWTELSLEALARKVGLEKLYGQCALWPTTQIHSTRAGLDARLRVSEEGIAFRHEPQPDHADYAVKFAFHLIVWLFHALNQFFGWGFDVHGHAQDVQTFAREMDGNQPG